MSLKVLMEVLTRGLHHGSTGCQNLVGKFELLLRRVHNPEMGILVSSGDGMDMEKVSVTRRILCPNTSL